LTLFLNATGGLGVYNSSLFPNYVNTHSIVFSESDINKWHLLTCVREVSTLKIYKDLYSETFIYQDPTFLNKTVKVDGFQTFLNNFELNHLLIYNSALTKSEIFKNYNNFYFMYVDQKKPHNNSAPNQVIQSDPTFLLPPP